MKLLLTGIIVFLFILYIYTYVRYKKMKNNRSSAVEDFKKKYHKEDKDPGTKVQNRANDFTTYTTKFNSTLDYVEREQLMEETQDVKKPKIVPKKLQF